MLLVHDSIVYLIFLIKHTETSKDPEYFSMDSCFDMYTVNNKYYVFEEIHIYR